jgi:ubiquinone/menaquinone biosynthesis C-methylase UbiE
MKIFQCNIAQEDLNGRTVIDLGCGHGSFLMELCDLGARCYGLDISGDGFEKDKALFFEGNACQKGCLYFIQASSHALPFKNDVADIVLCIEMIEHTEETKKVFREIHRILAPGKYCILSFPVRWVERLICFFCGHFPAFSGHVKQFSLAEMKDIAQSHGLSVLETKPWHCEWSFYYLLRAILGQIPKIDRRGSAFWLPIHEPRWKAFEYYYIRFWGKVHEHSVGKFLSRLCNGIMPKSYFLVLRKSSVQDPMAVLQGT